MKKIALFLIFSFTYASAGWHPLKLMTAYHGQDFHLKQGVAYVELRRFDSYTAMQVPKQHSVKTTHAFTMGANSLASYGSAIASQFRRLPMSGKKHQMILSGGQGHLGGYSSWYYNGFMLDTHHKMWRIETVKDLIDMVIPIDTPAEVKLVLWAHKHAEGFTTDSGGYHARYKKVGNNYRVEEHYAITDTAYGECGIYTYRSTVTRSGRITHRKRISKRPSQECGAE